MISHPAFPVDEWVVRETAYTPEVLAQAETVFTLANGYLGLRGNLDEGDPAFLLGTYLNGFHELRPIIYGERRYGYAEQSQTMLNVTDAKLLRLRIGGEPLDVRTGRLRSHVRTLDLRAGELTREVVWESPRGHTVAVTSRRLVSFDDRHLAAIAYEVTPLDGPGTLELESALTGNESNQVSEGDPREAAPLYGQVLLPQLSTAEGWRLALGHQTRTSKLRLVCAADHRLDAEGAPDVHVHHDETTARALFRVEAGRGETVRLVKMVAYHWSATDGPETLVARADRTLDAALARGYGTLAERQRAFVGDFWRRSDVVVDGDPEIQQGVRFAMFQVLQAAARADGAGIPAKGLTGQGYEGHSFWDTETFVVPVLAHTSPMWARAALSFRARTLDRARTRAAELHLRGALYPWRTIDGREASAYFPAGTAAYHIDADVACAIDRYAEVADDRAFLFERGADVLVETARMWVDRGHYCPRRGDEFCIDEVTGPDEYSALVDNNVYTNLMAAANLRAAADTVERMRREAPEAHAALAARTSLDDGEVDAWREAARRMRVPYDRATGVHPQDEHFLEHERWDLQATPPDRFPLLLHYHPLDLYRHQVLKQADLVLALHLQGDRFTTEQKRRDFAYYEPLTTGDSTLSAAPHAVIAAEIGDLDTAVGYLRASALVDLDDLSHNVGDGIHVAAMAGTWTALVAGLAGMRVRDGRLSFRPQLPAGWRRLRFPIAFRRRRLDVDIVPGTVTYTLLEGPDLLVCHGRREVPLEPGGPVAVPLDG